MESGALARMVEELEPRLGAVTGGPVPLDGGITNRNYRVQLGGRAYVVRVPATGLEALGIDRVTERACVRWAGEHGLGPRLVATSGACLVTEWVDAPPIEPGAVPDAAVDAMAEALRAVHAGPPLANRFDALAIVEGHVVLARQRAVPLPGDVDALLAAARGIRAWIGDHPDHAPAPCHNDLLAGNVLWDGARLWLVDWDYAAMGDRFFDLANFAQNNRLAPAQRERLLERYFGAPPGPRRRRALDLMRAMSDFREAMWGVVQQALSDLDFDYAAYAEEHFARLRATLEEVGAPAA